MSGDSITRALEAIEQRNEVLGGFLVEKTLKDRQEEVASESCTQLHEAPEIAGCLREPIRRWIARDRTS